MINTAPPGRPTVSRRLIGALLLSLLVHLLVLFAERFELAPTPPDLQPLHAQLRRAAPELPPAESAPPAATTPPAPAKPRPRQAKPPSELPRASLPEAPAVQAPPPEPATEATTVPPAEAAADPATVVEPAPPAPATPPPTPAGPRWPKAGRITFAVFRGEKQFEIGRAVQQWEVDENNHYRITATAETTGLAGFIKPITITQVSAGRIDEQGFRPEIFMVQREGHPGALRADFDWTAMKISMADGEHALSPGTQDLVSIFYQLGYPGYPQAAIEVPVTTAKKLAVYRFEVLGEEMLELPFGKTWRTLHVRARHEDTTEVWLALDYFSLPVKIRFIDRKGDLYDQWAIEVLVAKDAVDRKNP